MAITHQRLDNAVQNQVIHKIQSDIVIGIRNALMHGNLTQLATWPWRLPATLKQAQVVDEYANGIIFDDLLKLRVITNQLFLASPSLLTLPPKAK